MNKEIADRKPKTLKRKFILFVCLVYLIAGFLTIVAFYVGTDKIIRSLGAKFAVKHVLLEKNKILSVIDREVALALKLADDPLVKQWVLDENNQSLKKTAIRQLESYRNIFRDKSFFIAMVKSGHYYGFDVKKQQISITTLKENKPADRWFFESLRKLDTFALNVDYNAMINDTKVWINAIIKDEKGNKIAIGGSGLDITSFIRDIVRSKERGVSNILIDRTGIIQAHENRAYVLHNAASQDDAGKITVYNLIENQKDQVSLRKAIDTLTSGSVEVETFTTVLEKKRYVAAVTFMKEIGWYNIVLIDVSQVVQILDFLPIIIVIIFSLLFVLIVVALMLNRIILNPLTVLADASRQVSQGKYDIFIPVEGDDEFGQLTAIFNAMTVTIHDHTSNLEKKINERTVELINANKELATSREQVMDSIYYARKIQDSILPDRTTLLRYLKDYFIIYAPRDIIGGDFYYFRELGDNFLIAIVDCTGHGVPGAFVTMTVNSVLNHVIDSICNDDPGRILCELNRIIRKTLHQGNSDLLLMDSGLDIALCFCRPIQRVVTFAGAGLSLYYTRDDEIEEMRGDRQRVGYKGSKTDFIYQNHKISLLDQTCLYMTTDGILDQAGGEKGYGFGRNRFVDMIRPYSLMTMKEQEAIYENIIKEYKGRATQRDDILFLGFRI